MTGLKLLIYRMLHPLVSWARSRPIVLKALFGVAVTRGSRIHYDTTTVLLKRALAREVAPDDRVLEMGIGQAALLSLNLARTKKLVPSGVDVSHSRVASSIETAAFNNVEAKFWQSNLFESVDGNYDIIFFNPPYVDTGSGRKLNLSKRLSLESDAAWDGGARGTDIIEKFINDSGKNLAPGGRLIIGVQNFYVGREDMERMAKTGEYYIEDVMTSSLNPSRVYVMKKIGKTNIK